MMTNVPQFIDVEDKVAGPLTWKQLGWMIGMSAVLFLLYTLAEGMFFYLLAIPTALLFLALAFYRPNGMTFAQFLFYSVAFLFQPKVIVWERPTHRTVPKVMEPENTTETTAAKKVDPKDFEALARIVDTKK
jgi:predicted membrane protein